MNVWVNDPNFKELGNERDPFVGTQDGTFDYTIPEATHSKETQGPSCIHHNSRRSLFFSSRASRTAFLCGRMPGCTAHFVTDGETAMAQIKKPPSHIQPGSGSTQIHPR